MIKAVYLNDFNLIAGGNINLTSGVNTVVLDSVGPDTQVHLRELPPAPSTTTTTSTTSTVGIVSESGLNSSGSLKAVNVSTVDVPAARQPSDTLEAGQSTTITNDGITASYTVGGNGNQTLSAERQFHAGYQHR